MARHDSDVFCDYAAHRDALLAVARDRWIAYEIGWLARADADRPTFVTERACLDYALASGKFASSLIVHVGHEAYLRVGINGTAI